jgi:Chaperone of endosialidase
VRTTDPNDGLRIRVDTTAGATERVRVTAAGNVGIGTPRPGAPLHVADHMVVGPFVAVRGQGALEVTGPVAELGFVRRSLTAWPAFPAQGDRFAWYNPDGTARLWTEGRGDLMIVTAQGNVGIGTIPVQKLHVAGAFLQVNGAGNEQAYIGGDGAGADVQLGSMNPNVQNIGIWNQAASRRMTLFAADFIKVSDARQKTNIRDISHALEQVKRLRGIAFEPLEEEPQAAGAGPRQHLGFIAQEVNDILPEVVSQDSKGMYGISYTSVIPLLVEAIKEQQQHIVKLQEELAALKARA